MNKYLALLRGINVGGKKKVEMPKLQQAFLSLNYQNVSTYINTGNVIFSTTGKDLDKIKTEIENKLAKTFGFSIKIVLRTADNIKKLSKNISVDWQNDATQKTDVLFLWPEFENKKSLDLLKINPAVDRLKYISGAIIWNINKKEYSKSGMNKFIGTVIYKNMTARNINTVRKLAELLK